MLETGDFRLLQNKYIVKFTESKEKETVTLDFIRVSKPQQVLNKQMRLDIQREKREKMEQREAEKSGDFIVPENLKYTSTDTDKLKEQKKKKIKALKYNHKINLQKRDANVKQNSWLNFNSKGIKKGSGHFKSQKDESIFKTSEMGKVGVSGSSNHSSK